MSIARNKTGKALARLIEKMGRGEVEALLGDWNGSELTEDGTKIIFYDRRNDTGKWDYPKGDFFKWLFSDEPLDPTQYALDPEWLDRVKLARQIATEV
jgi:hypothetical protein